MKKRYKLISIIILVCFLASTIVYAKSKYDKTGELINVAPIANIGAKSHPKAVNIQVVTDYKEQKLLDAESQLNQLKNTMLSNGIDIKYNIINGNSANFLGNKVDTDKVAVIHDRGLDNNYHWWLFYVYNSDIYVIEDNKTPVKLNNINNVLSVVTDKYNLYALKKDGTVWKFKNTQWVDRSYIGTIPTQITGLSGIKKMVANNENILAIDGNKQVWYSNLYSAWNVTGTGEVIDISTVDFPGNFAVLDVNKNLWRVDYNISTNNVRVRSIASQVKSIIGPIADDMDNTNYMDFIYSNTSNKYYRVTFTDSSSTPYLLSIKPDKFYYSAIGFLLYVDNNGYVNVNTNTIGNGTNHLINELSNIKLVIPFYSDSALYIYTVDNNNNSKIGKVNYHRVNTTYYFDSFELIETDNFNNIGNKLYSVNANIQSVESGDNIFIYLSDGQGNDFSKPFGEYYSFGNLNKDLVKKLSEKSYTSYAVTPQVNWDYKLPESNIQELTIRQLVSLSDKDNLYDVGQFQQCLDDILYKYINKDVNISLLTDYTEPSKIDSLKSSLTYLEADLKQYNINLKVNNVAVSNLDFSKIGGSSSTIPMKKGITISNYTPNIKVGDYVEFGKYNNETVKWRVINIDSNGIMIFAESIISIKPFSGNYIYRIGESGIDTERAKFGTNYWPNSNIRAWLNSANLGVGYFDGFPSADYVSYNAYASEPGFLYNFSSDDQQLVNTVTHETIIPEYDAIFLGKKDGGVAVYNHSMTFADMTNYDFSYYKNVSDKVFLLSRKELYDYVYSRGWDIKAKPTQSAVNKNNNPNVSPNASNYWYYMLRTPMAYTRNNILGITSEGTVYNDMACYSQFAGIRPALYLKPTITSAEGNGTYSSPYKIGKLDVSSVNSEDFQTIKTKNYEDKYFLYVSDGEGNNFGSGWGNYYSFGGLNNSFSNHLKNNEFTAYAVSPSTTWDYTLPESTVQNLTIRQLVENGVNEGKLFDKGQVNEALLDIKDKILSKLGMNGKPLYLCTDESLEYIKYYSDYEGDLQNDERFKYSHDWTLFENNTGPIINNNVWVSDEITQFNKTGKYVISYQAQDDPLGRILFNNYNKWSVGENQLTLIVHNRPVSEFEYRVNNSTFSLAITNTSYDIDHLSEAAKGIVQSKWKWKNINDLDWTYGNPPSSLIYGQTYAISLEVKDKEGAWSYPTIKTFKVGENHKPVAKFSLDKISMYQGEVNNITDLSYDPDEDPLAEWHWYILDDTGTTIINDYGGTKPNLSVLPSGSYSIGLLVRDNPVIPPSLWSDIYILPVNIIDNLSVDGQVNHTTDWNNNRIKYNREKTNTDDSPRTYDVFFPGEKFMLKALTTEGAACNKVIVHIQEYPDFYTELTNTSNNIWEGNIWDKTMVDWKDQNLNFEFTAIYANGTIKTDVVPVKVLKDEYWRIHRDF